MQLWAYYDVEPYLTKPDYLEFPYLCLTLNYNCQIIYFPDVHKGELSPAWTWNNIKCFHCHVGASINLVPHSSYIGPCLVFDLLIPVSCFFSNQACWNGLNLPVVYQHCQSVPILLQFSQLYFLKFLYAMLMILIFRYM